MWNKFFRLKEGIRGGTLSKIWLKNRLPPHQIPASGLKGFPTNRYVLEILDLQNASCFALKMNAWVCCAPNVLCNNMKSTTLSKCLASKEAIKAIRKKTNELKSVVDRKAVLESCLFHSNCFHVTHPLSSRLIHLKVLVPL